MCSMSCCQYKCDRAGVPHHGRAAPVELRGEGTGGAVRVRCTPVALQRARNAPPGTRCVPGPRRAAQRAPHILDRAGRGESCHVTDRTEAADAHLRPGRTAVVVSAVIGMDSSRAKAPTNGSRPSGSTQTSVARSRWGCGGRRGCRRGRRGARRSRQRPRAPPRTRSRTRVSKAAGCSAPARRGGRYRRSGRPG